MQKILLAAAAVIGMTASAQAGPTPYVGELQTVGFNFCPQGFLPADGRLVAISDYSVLYDLYGTTYGGDGVTTFALPNMPLKQADHKTTIKICLAWAGVFPSKN